MATEVKKADKKSPKGLTPEEILNGFNTLRTDQRSLATKVSEFEIEVNDHKMVIETLKNVDGERKCHRLIGGILVEKQVKDVLPALETNKEKLLELIEKLNEQLGKKGQEINDYKEKHNIRVRGQDDLKEEEQESKPDATARGNVLVS